MHPADSRSHSHSNSPSPPDASTYSDNEPSSARRGGSAEEQDLLKQLDATADLIQAHIPDEPYILTIPQEEPKYHHYSRHLADAWLINSPFTHHEDYQVQYQSFIYREPYTDLFERVRYSHFDRASKPALASSSLAPSRSATNTPTVGPKKKISLAAYKNKQAQPNLSTPTGKERGSRPSGTSDSVRPKEKERQSTGLAHQPVKPEKPTTTERDSSSRQSRSAPQNDLKRPRPHTERDSGSMTSTTKKLRLSPPLLSGAPNSSGRQSRQRTETKREASIPPERLSPLGLLYLPGRLSPTLPPALVAALDEGQHNLQTSNSSADNNNPAKPALPRPVSKHDSVLSRAADGPSKDAASPPNNVFKEAPHMDNKRSRSLIIVLKIPKKHRSNFRRLVQFNPRATTKEDRKPDQSAITSPHDVAQHATSAKKSVRAESGKRVPEDKDDATKGAAWRISATSRTAETLHIPDASPVPATASSTASSTANKRPRAPSNDTLQPDAKRNKLPAPLKLDKAPSTPIPPDFRSPALPHSALKSQQATPNAQKDRTSVSMKRIESTDSLVNTTPTVNNRTPSSRPSTSTTHQSQRPASNTRPSPLATSAKTPESQAWSAEQSRLGALAKELKHAAVLPTAQAGESSSKARKAAEAATLASIESFIAFVLSFYCADKSWTCRQPSQIPGPENWTSCHAYFRAVLARCQPYPHLAGLTAYLGTAYNGVIMRRTSSGKSEPAKMQEAVSGALKTADEASAKLPLSILRSEFPQTWKRGSLSGAIGEAQVKPGQYEGGFSLAIGIQTDPLEAARFCHSLLTEWCAKGDSDYKIRLKLSA